MISRRHFLQSSLSVALVPLVPRFVFAQTTLRVRPSWQAFASGPLFPVFLNTVSKMRANTNVADPNSWGYWVETHKNLCPHRVKYFLTWHRGFLFRFEAQLRKVAANNGLILPYWDYYTHPDMPSQFTDPTSPLYQSGRVGTNVRDALSLNAFDDAVVNFPRFTTNAFETKLETLPHNAVHNLIGGVMSNVTLSPTDPIFWVHHANIDRLWAAWVRADNGRTMPPLTSTYWPGSFNYGPAVATMGRKWTISTTSLNYQYDNEIMPSALPPPAAPAAPAALQLEAIPPRPLGTQNVTLGGARQLALDERSISIVVPLTVQDRARVRSLLLKQAAPKQPADIIDNSVRVVLDGVRLTGLGAKGGYFYKVYINLPEATGVGLAESAYLLGTLGPFEITAEEHHAMRGAHMHASGDGVRLVYPVAQALQKIWPTTLDKLTVSFVRVTGSTPVKGTVIHVKEFRVEAAEAPAM